MVYNLLLLHCFGICEDLLPGSANSQQELLQWKKPKGVGVWVIDMLCASV